MIMPLDTDSRLVDKKQNTVPLNGTLENTSRASFARRSIIDEGPIIWHFSWRGFR